MLYNNIKPMKVYNHQSNCPLPVGDKPGFGNSVFLFSPTKITGENILLGNYLNYSISKYKYYIIDFIYKDKIGYKRIIQNNSGLFKKDFESLKFPSSMSLVMPANKKAILKRNINNFVNLGQWNDYYFLYSIRGSLKKICENYISFINNRINDPSYDGFNKIIYIDGSQWLGTKKIGISREFLDNPISILLATAYKEEELFKSLGDFTVILADSKAGSILKIPSTFFTKDKYPKLKNVLMTMEGISDSVIQDLEEIENSTNKNISDIEKIVIQKNKKLGIVNSNTSMNNLSDTDPDKIVSKISAINNTNVNKARDQIISSLKKNLLGDTEDLTSALMDEDDIIDNQEYPDNITLKNEEDITAIANKYIDNNPELLNEVDMINAVNEITDEIKKKVYISKFIPEYSEEQIKRIDEMSFNQDKIIGLPSIKDLESKIIDEDDISNVVNTENANILKPKFKNFDKCYNEKKLHKDIDESIGILAGAEVPIYITEKIEEDTSDQLNLKKTITYKLKDINGNKMNVKLDIPIVIDDNYVYLNGSKKLLQHQLILKPIVKTKAGTVQIVTHFNKLFLMVRGTDDLKSSLVLKAITANKNIFDVQEGKPVIMNNEYITSKEFDIFARNIYQFEIDSKIFILDILQLLKTLDKKGISYKNIDLSKKLIIGYDEAANKPLVIDAVRDSYTNTILSYLPEEIKTSIQTMPNNANVKSRKFMYTEMKIMNKRIPIITFLLFCEGFKSIMNKANIKYNFISREEAKKTDLYKYGLIELNDGYIRWERYPLENSLLLNGLNSINLSYYSYEELESKDTYINILSNFYEHSNMAYNLSQYKDFMIDTISKEILQDFHYPTDLAGLIIFANKWLVDNEYYIESDMKNLRVRSNELIAMHVYDIITNAYGPYRKSQFKSSPTKISIKQDAVLSAIKKSSITEDESVLNPVHQLAKIYGVTYKGERGIGLAQAMTLDKRAYNDSMVGTIGITTTNDANVGVSRQLTLEPNITSTRGYIDVVDSKDIDKLNCANLLTPSELLTPLGVQHDDPARTTMAYKQTMYMLNVDDSDPAMIGNGVEKVIPYYMSKEFTIVAEDDGKVVDIKNGLVVIQYKNGKFQTIDTNKQVKHNSSAGFFIASQLTCDKKIGDKIVKNEVVAWNEGAFKKNNDDLSASMKLGTLVKIAVIPEWDIYEDSAPISANASKKMSTSMIMDTKAVLNKFAFVSEMAKVGDDVKTGDVLIKFDNNAEDPEIAELYENIRTSSGDDDLANDIIESSYTTKKSKYSGKIVDIKVYSSVEIDELSPSLQSIVSDYYEKIKSKDRLLEKYKNPGDCKFYKSGQLITESPIKIEPDMQGRIKSEQINEGILIIFYIEFHDIMSRGDKLSAEFALKSINSHVIDEELTPYSEFNPDEGIDLITAPLSISARKTPSIFIAMFGNKCIIEAKRFLKKYWEEN